MATGALLSRAARRLEGKVAVITGGAGGIGESTTRLFSKHGAGVIIADIRDNLGKFMCEDLGPDTASFVHCNMSSESDIENAIATAVDKHGKLDIMVNNAATVDPFKANILDNDKADFERMVSVNLTGVFLGTNHAARAMIPSRTGSIINLGSVSWSVGGVATHAYTSSKHGIVGLTRNVAAELRRYEIHVNCLSPYFILSPLSKEFFNVVQNGRVGVYSNLDGVSLQQEDVAEAALFLGSDRVQVHQWPKFGSAWRLHHHQSRLWLVCSSLRNNTSSCPNYCTLHVFPLCTFCRIKSVNIMSKLKGIERFLFCMSME